MPGTVISLSGDGVIAQWDILQGGNAVVLAKINTQVFSGLIIPGQQLALGTMGGSIHILDLKMKKEIKHLALHNKPIFSLVFNHGSNQLWAASGDGTVSVWEWPEYKLISHSRISKSSIRCLAFDAVNNLFFAGSSDKNLYVVQSNSFKITHKIPAHENSVFTIAIAPDGSRLYTGGRDAGIRVWKAGEVPQMVHVIPAHMDTVNKLAVAKNGFMASAGKDKHVKIWDVETYSLLKVIDFQKFEGHQRSVNAVVWDEQNSLLVSAGDDRLIMVWEINFD